MKKDFIGYFCSYIPLEIISAAGFIPYRVNGTGDFPEKSYSYIPGNFCMFAKNCLNHGLTLDREKFKGFIFANSCDSMERLYDIWKHYFSSSFVHLLSVPRKSDDLACEHFTLNLGLLKKTFEKYLNVHITDDNLKKYIKIYNEGRELFKQISLLRESKDYFIPSSLIVKTIIEKKDPELLNEKFREILEKKEEFLSKEKPRIIISGSFMEDLTFIEIIENSGANIVYEDFCSLNRHFDEKVDENKDPLEALGERYLKKIPCARMEGSTSSKIIKFKELVKKYSISGIIFYLIKFCDIFSWEIYRVVKELHKENIPVLLIEGDYPVKSLGQTTTRIEAFIEMISEEKE